ncbi:MAG: hypothetical protein ACREQ9_20835 [Candidatus Binatia bacterium]
MRRRLPRVARRRRLPATILLASACTLPALSRPEDVREEVSVAITVPNPCWSVRIEQVYRRKDTLLVVSELSPPPSDVMCAQVIATARDRVFVRVPGPRPRVDHLVLDRRGGGKLENDPVYRFFGSRRELEAKLAGAEPIGGETAPPER